MALKGCYGCLKWTVFLINLLFWLAGVGVLGLSLWILFDTTMQVAQGSASFAVGTYIVLGVGALMSIVGFLGCCGAIRESQCLLGTFFIFLLIIFVATISAGVYAFMNRAEINKAVQDVVRKTVQKDYKRDPLATKQFDVIQETLKCCGSDGVSSWANSYFNGISSEATVEIGIPSSLTYSVPASCCVDPKSDACETMRKMGSPGVVGSQLFGVIHSQGCSQKIGELAYSYTHWIFYIGIGVGLIELLGMIFSLLLCCAIRKIEDFKA